MNLISYLLILNSISMPRKTRKEKLAAQLRKLRETTQTSKTTANDHRVEMPKVKYVPEILPKISAEKDKSADEFSSIYSDIKRVGLVIVVTLIFQIGLNLTLRTNFVKLLLRN